MHLCVLVKLDKCLLSFNVSLGDHYFVFLNFGPVDVKALTECYLLISLMNEIKNILLRYESHLLVYLLQPIYFYIFCNFRSCV